MPVTAPLELDGLSVDWWRRLANGRWSLCLGAGINGQLMPDWLDLTRRVVNQTAAAYSAHYSAPGLHRKVKDFTVTASYTQPPHLGDRKKLGEHSFLNFSKASIFIMKRRCRWIYVCLQKRSYGASMKPSLSRPSAKKRLLECFD